MLCIFRLQHRSGSRRTWIRQERYVTFTRTVFKKVPGQVVRNIFGTIPNFDNDKRFICRHLVTSSVFSTSSYGLRVTHHSVSFIRMLSESYSNRKISALLWGGGGWDSGVVPLHLPSRQCSSRYLIPMLIDLFRRRYDAVARTLNES